MIKSLWNFSPSVISRDMVKKYFASERISKFLPNIDSMAEGEVLVNLVSDRAGGDTTIVLMGHIDKKNSFTRFKPNSDKYIDFAVSPALRTVGTVKKFRVHSYAGVGGSLTYGVNELFFKNVILYDWFAFPGTTNCTGIVTIATRMAKGKIVVNGSQSLIIGHYTFSGQTFKCDELDVTVNSDMMIETVNGCTLKAKKLTIRVPEKCEFSTKEIGDALTIMDKSESIILTSHDQKQLIELAGLDRSGKFGALLKTGIDTAPYMLITKNADLTDFIGLSPKPEKMARLDKFLKLMGTSKAPSPKFASYIDVA